MQLVKLRKELQFNTELLSLIETLKSIAASQYHMLEKEKERFGQFMDAFADFFRVVNLVRVENPLVRVTSDVLGIVVVTSDSGFMGGLNQGVLRRAAELQGDLPDDKVSLTIIGDKGASSLSDSGRPFTFFGGISQDTIYEQAVEIKDHLVNEVLERRAGKVAVVYPKPVSFSSQTIEVLQLLPCAELFDVKAAAEPAARPKAKGLLAEASKVIVESSFEDMVRYLASVWVTSRLFEVFEDSKLAEFSARALHLEGSSDKVKKERKKLEHMVFRAAHEKIDKGMRESFSATKTKKKKDKRDRDRDREAA